MCCIRKLELHLFNIHTCCRVFLFSGAAIECHVHLVAGIGLHLNCISFVQRLIISCRTISLLLVGKSFRFFFLIAFDSVTAPLFGLSMRMHIKIKCAAKPTERKSRKNAANRHEQRNQHQRTGRTTPCKVKLCNKCSNWKRTGGNGTQRLKYCWQCTVNTATLMLNCENKSPTAVNAFNFLCATKANVSHSEEETPAKTNATKTNANRFWAKKRTKYLYEY